MADEYEKSMDNLREDVQELRTLFENFAKDLKGAARGKVRRGETWIKEAAGDVKECSRTAYDECRSTMEAHPGVTALGALGLGMLLGKLLLRR